MGDLRDGGVAAGRALLLGLVQGVTEVVPVSSSAHLTAVPWLLGWAPAGHRTTLAAGLHAGSCLGIAVALTHPPRPTGRTAALAVATCLPAAVAGLVAADAVERRLGRPRQLAALLAAAGVLMALADRRPQDRHVGPREAAYAALAQVAALAPGVSRSGAALTALRGARVPLAEAQEFALLMSLPVTAGAALLTLTRSGRRQRAGLAVPLGIGAPTAALAGWATTRLQARLQTRLQARLQGRPPTRRPDRRGSQVLVIFAVYRLAAAAVISTAARRRPPASRQELL